MGLCLVGLVRKGRRKEGKLELLLKWIPLVFSAAKQSWIVNL